MVRVLIKTLDGKSYLTSNLVLFRNYEFLKQNPSSVMQKFDFGSDKFPGEVMYFRICPDKISPLGVIYEEYNKDLDGKQAS